MKETNTTFNIEKIADIVKDFTDADYTITKAHELYETGLTITNEYKAEQTTLLAYQENGSLGFENNKVAKELYTQANGNIYSAKRYDDFYIVELENEKNMGYIIVKVTNGALMSNNKKKVFNKKNDHKVIEVAWSSKEFYNKIGIFQNELTYNEYKDLKKFVNISNRLR
jgi:hypothetical protein